MSTLPTSSTDSAVSTTPAIPPEPKLAPPGAGIPFPARVVLRFVVGPLVAARSDWNEDLLRFHRETEKIQDILADLSAEELTLRILVPPMRGLEDSSRYWSVAMTLEHLKIVGTRIEQVIGALSRGQVPPGEASTAAVKPGVKEDGDAVVKEFRGLMSQLADRTLQNLVDRDSRARYRHPWFGPFTAKQWFWLLPTHQGIHRRQIEAIRRGLQDLRDRRAN